MRGLGQILAASLLFSIPAACIGAVELPSIMSDHMVLQQGAAVPIWGWSEPGSAVTVEFAGQQKKAVVGEDGKWLVRLDPLKASAEPRQMTIRCGEDSVTISDVLVGEVWVAGGQSNMWWHMDKCKNAKEEIAAADYPLIRIWDANTSPLQNGWRADEPQRTVRARWVVSSPKVAGNFPGTPFFFARDLHKRLSVPVGVVHVAVPGSPIEPFLSESYVREHDPAVLANIEKAKKEYVAQRRAYEEGPLKAWEKAQAKAKEAGDAPPPKPRAPRDPMGRWPGGFMNGMILPAAPYAAKGFIWWQGEANANRFDEYAGLMANLIREWRAVWERPDMPFIYVELHNFGNKQPVPVQDAPWPALRDAQQKALRAVDHAYMICALDVKEDEERDWQIHPRRKQRPGHRLCQVALSEVYGDASAHGLSPLFDRAEFDGEQAIIHFSNVDRGLMRREGDDELRGFALAGGDRRFHWAQARIEGDTVILSSPDVPAPIAARYAWANHPIGNLVSGGGLPAHPFRTDDWVLTAKD